MGCVHGTPRQRSHAHGFDGSAQMALPRYSRPTFGAANLVQSTSRETLQRRLSEEEIRYNDFLNERLLVAQRTWLSNVQIRGSEAESADALSTYPCINYSASSGQLEQIKTSEESGRLKVTRLLYIYMPEQAARLCRREHSLNPVPDCMRFEDFGDLRKIIAVDIPPYSTITSKAAMVERFHSVGCGSVDETNIECCIVIPETDWIQYDTTKDIYTRIGFGPIDVLAAAPVLFGD